MNPLGRIRSIWKVIVGAVAILGVLVLSGAVFLDSWLVVERPLEKADALVLMAGSPAVRLPTAVKLFEMAKASRILLTNDGILGAWSPAHQRNLYQVEWARLDLIDRGVPPEAIEVLGFSRSGTYYDALNTRVYVREKGIKSLIVVTSDYHTRRTLWAFNRLLPGDSVAIGIYPAGRPSLAGRSLVERWARLETLSYELCKFIYYKIRF